MAKFCLNYYRFDNQYLNKADELKIQFNPNDATLPDFIEKYKDKSIVIDVRMRLNEGGDAIEVFNESGAIIISELNKKYNNIKIMFAFEDKVSYNLAEQYKIPFFFSNKVGTLDEMHGLAAYYPTDIYICEELGFSLANIAPILHEKGIKIRVFPNICQSSFAETPSLYTFFIRPEDIPIYANFVDIFELVSDEERQSIIFKIYKQGKWFGKINEIIPSYKGELDNRHLLDNFGLFRSKCDKRCMRKLNTCGICAKYMNIADSFKETGIYISHKPADF